MELTQASQGFDWHGKTGSRIVWVGFMFVMAAIVYVGCTMMDALVANSLDRDLQRYEGAVAVPAPTRAALMQQVVDTKLGVACFRAQAEQAWSCVGTE